MNRPTSSWLNRLLPAGTPVNGVEVLRSCVGAAIGIVLTGVLSREALGTTTAALWLMAPMGASAVLLFAVPSSPLAQPWSIVGGNLAAALIGVTCYRAIGTPILAASAAILLAIAAMFMLRCLHPPSGAVALTAVLGGPEIHAAGYGFVVAPVAINTIALLAVALLYNNVTGRRYPHVQVSRAQRLRLATDAKDRRAGGFRTEDLEAVLKEHNEVLDVSVDDLEALYRETEKRAFRRRFGDTRCDTIMSADVPAVEYATELGEAWQLMRANAVHALPVVNRARHVIGIVTRADFIRNAELHEYRTLGARLRDFLRRTPHTHSTKDEVVGQIMSAPVRTAHGGAPIVDLVSLMSDAGLRHVPIVDAERRLVGMVTQPRLVAALYESSLARLDDCPAAA